MCENLKFPSTSQDILSILGLTDDKPTLLHGATGKGGNMSGSLFYDPSDTVHQRMVALAHSFDYTTTGLKPSERKMPWNLKLNQYATAKNWTFTGILEKFDIAAAVGAALKADFSVMVESTTVYPT